ncbi:MAG TPA: LarC family nickel insertion protein, partial [Firmicutes bacterium]|nr:LarC family nickel insertion protein [Bacillota bacterium]
CAIALEMLGIEKVTASPLPVGRGFVKAAHGLLPLPAPATLEICRQKSIPLVAPPLEVKEELVTPTGAALLGALAVEFSPTPSGTPLAVGYGAGDNDFPFPNLLRLLLFQEDNNENTVLNALIEANIDDMNPEIYGFLMEELFLIGARDVYFTPVQMKKNRPGVKISILTPLEKAPHIREFVLTQTTTLGVREMQVAKYYAERTVKEIVTPWGKVRVKISFYNGKVVNQAPEYEDCLKISRRLGIPLKAVYQKVFSCLEANN